MSSISKADLEKSSGAEGAPAWVAADGKVYDVSESRMWKNGRHMNSHSAGVDLSLELKAAPHGPEVLERVKLLGDYAGENSQTESIEFPEAPDFLKPILARHPHPVSVHFPMALLLIAAALSALRFFITLPGMDYVILYNLVIGTLAAPASVASGLLSWYFNYGGIWTPIYKKKAFLSSILILWTCALVAVRFLLVDPGQPDGAWWVFQIGTILAAPIVMSIGYLGGKITFPTA